MLVHKLRMRFWVVVVNVDVEKLGLRWFLNRVLDEKIRFGLGLGGKVYLCLFAFLLWKVFVRFFLIACMRGNCRIIFPCQILRSFLGLRQRFGFFVL